MSFKPLNPSNVIFSSLQKFKLSVANTVVSAENSSLASMGTSHLLELFEEPHGSEGAKRKPTSGLKAMLARMEDAWEEGQYEDEYSMAAFVRKLGGAGE